MIQTRSFDLLTPKQKREQLRRAAVLADLDQGFDAHLDAIAEPEPTTPHRPSGALGRSAGRTD